MMILVKRASQDKKENVVMLSKGLQVILEKLAPSVQEDLTLLDVGKFVNWFFLSFTYSIH